MNKVHLDDSQRSQSEIVAWVGCVLGSARGPVALALTVEAGGGARGVVVAALDAAQVDAEGVSVAGGLADVAGSGASGEKGADKSFHLHSSPRTETRLRYKWNRYIGM